MTKRTPLSRFVVLSGCSGGGKSTLLAELARRGHTIVEEPGRRIVAAETACGGLALPWIDMAGFLARAHALAQADLAMAAQAPPGWVFFDRGLVDAACGLAHETGAPALEGLGPGAPYHPLVFLTPPWPEIYVTDSERRHDIGAALAEYDRLIEAYRGIGHQVEILAKVDVARRADHMLDLLGSTPAP